MPEEAADLFKKAKLMVAPDPATGSDMLYAGTFLYFDAPIILTIPPQVITTDSFRILDRVRNERPDWTVLLMGVLGTWAKKKDQSLGFLKLIEPLSEDAFITAWLSYSANDAALARARELITSTGWTTKNFLSSIDTDNACGELVRHIFLEKFLEFDRDLGELYNYAASICTSADFDDRLADAYALRILGLISHGEKKISIALTNRHLVNFLADLPGQEAAQDSGASLFEKDAVAMMIFNGLLSNWIDPITDKTVEILCRLRQSKRGEIDRLKGKCLLVAEQVDRSRDAEALFGEVEEKIRFNILPEVGDLLDLGESAFRDYKEKLFGDRVFWTGFIGTVVSAISGKEFASAAAAVSTLASMGAKAFSHYREIRQTVKKSDYSLIYTVAKMTKS